MKKQNVVLVDKKDRQLGVEALVAAHRGQGQLHRAISVFIFRKCEDNEAENSKLELLLQQRSAQKLLGGEKWANTVCGHVLPGESYRHCAERRLKHELGLAELGDLKLKPLTKFPYQVKINQDFSEHELDQAFFAHWPEGWTVKNKLKLNPTEVKAVKWYNWTSLLKLNGQELNDQSKLRLTAWFQHFLTNTKLITKIQKFNHDLH